MYLRSQCVQLCLLCWTSFILRDGELYVSGSTHGKVGVFCSALVWPVLCPSGCYDIPNSQEKGRFCRYGFVCYINTTVQEEGGTSLRMGSAQHAMGKFIQDPLMLHEHKFPCTLCPSPMQNECKLWNSESLESSMTQAGSVTVITSLLPLKHSMVMEKSLQSSEQPPMWTQRSQITASEDPMTVVQHTLHWAVQMQPTSPKYTRKLEKGLEITNKNKLILYQNMIQVTSISQSFLAYFLLFWF